MVASFEIADASTGPRPPAFYALDLGYQRQAPRTRYRLASRLLNDVSEWRAHTT